MDMQQMVGKSGMDDQDMGMDQKMMDMMVKMRAMMDQMIQMMGAEGKRAGFESVNQEA